MSEGVNEAEVMIVAVEIDLEAGIDQEVAIAAVENHAPDLVQFLASVNDQDIRKSQIESG